MSFYITFVPLLAVLVLMFLFFSTSSMIWVCGFFESEEQYLFHFTRGFSEIISFVGVIVLTIFVSSWKSKPTNSFVWFILTGFSSALGVFSWAILSDDLNIWTLLSILLIPVGTLLHWFLRKADEQHL